MDEIFEVRLRFEDVRLTGPIDVLFDETARYMHEIVDKYQGRPFTLAGRVVGIPDEVLVRRKIEAMFESAEVV